MDEVKKIFEDAQNAMRILDQRIQEITEFRDSAALEIAQYIRIEKGIELDPDAIRATLTRPYTLLPINEHEAWMIAWRGIRMPVFGQIVAQEPAFIKARVTRTMNLITPFPKWVMDDLGWKPPVHKAIIDSTRSNIQLTEGDESSFRRRYGQFLGTKRGEGAFGVKGGDGWIKLVAALVRDGILPYTPTPVDEAHWNENASIPDELAEIIALMEQKAGSQYIHRATEEFTSRGAVLINYPPGAGKTLAGCLILNHFVGETLILVDSTFLQDHWKDRVKHWAPNANVTISTYQGAAKYAKKKWDLIIPDEAQRFPANTFSKLAFIQTLYRCGLTGTAWREDNRQHLIVALSGFPVTINWSELINLGVLQRPRVIVATVSTLEAKTGYVKNLLTHSKGRAIIYCDWLEQGQALANALDVPFIQGTTRNKLQILEQSDVAVVSRVGDRGLDLPDLRLVIEVAGAGAAREQFAQRVGRLLHGRFKGEFHTVFTPDEMQRYRGRFFGVEAEGLEVEFVQVGKVAEEKSQPYKSHAVKAARRESVIKERASKPKDEIARILSLPAVSARVMQAKKSLGQDSSRFVERVLRYCWSTSLSSKEIVEGLGLTGPNAFSRINTACKAAVKFELMTVDDQERYRVNREKIDRLEALSSLRTGGV